MSNIEPETEAGTSTDELSEGLQNISGISFNVEEDVKGGLGTDQDMFPNFDPKGKESDQK